MLKNIIFDMGNVLTEYEPECFIERVGITDAADKQQLMREIFLSQEWKLNDKGELDEAQLEEIVLKRIDKHLHEAAHRLIYGWDRLSKPIDGMAQLVRDCKAAGLGIYLLSNASRRQPKYWVNIPGSEYFDGTFVSAFHLCLKPSGEIFHRALNTFGLKAEECLFVDDTFVNVDGARRVGMMGFHFTGDADALRKAIRNMGAAV